MAGIFGNGLGVEHNAVEQHATSTPAKSVLDQDGPFHHYFPERVQQMMRSGKDLNGEPTISSQFATQAGPPSEPSKTLENGVITDDTDDELIAFVIWLSMCS